MRILRVEGNHTGRDIKLPNQDFGAIANVGRNMFSNQMLFGISNYKNYKRQWTTNDFEKSRSP